MGNTSRIISAGCVALLLAGCAFAPSLSEDEKLEMRDSASEYQQAVLDDLVVSETEYRDAVNAARTCSQDAGWGVGPIEQQRNQLGFWSSSSGDAPPADETMQACYDEYLMPVGSIWVSQRTKLSS